MKNDSFDLKKIEKTSDKRENLLKKIMQVSEIIENFSDSKNFLVLSRQWNSWYPSSLNVEGGCYFMNINGEIIIIDPGFNTIEEIKKFHLDVRLIRHVFVTHFHPDHFENLIKILTRLTSQKNPINIYLNKTNFNQFKIYKKEYTYFMELKAGMIIDLQFNKKNPELKVIVEVGNAFHREIGGATSAVGLKFEIIDRHISKRHKIGFLSDTDGSDKYIDYYCSFYGDCDLIIVHIGSIGESKSPIGYKHLYQKGLDTLLSKLQTQGFLKDKKLFIGEFGFELSDIHTFNKACEEIIHNSMNYLTLIKSFLNYAQQEQEKEQEDDKEINLGFIYTSSFKKCVQEISDLYPTLELIAPFFFPLEGDPQSIILEAIEDIEISKIDINSIYDIFTQSIIFDSKELTLSQEELRGFASQIFGNEKVQEFFLKTTWFFKYMNRKEKEWWLNKIRDNQFINLNPSNLSDIIKFNVNEFASNEEYIVNDGKIPDISYFTKIVDKISQEQENKLNVISLLLFALYVVWLADFNDFNSPPLGEVDGRESICKHFQSKYDFGTKGCVLPVHPSYKIIFMKEVLSIEGYCSNYHLNTHLITDYNQDWSIKPRRL